MNSWKLLILQILIIGLMTSDTITTLLIGVLLFAWGLVTIVVPIYDYVLLERLKMDQKYPPYKEWEIPSPEVRLNVYIFAAENSEAFLNGTDDKLRLTEIGPIVYREHLQHQNVTFHENSTLSYNANRRVEFIEEYNEPGILNRTILVPNFPLLATIVDQNDKFFFQKLAFQKILEYSGDKLFLNMTIYEYLWFYRSDMIESVKSIAPSFVPTNNSGCLYQIYSNFNDRYNVRIGPDYDNTNFFTITTVNGRPVVPRFDVEHGECNATIDGATEGALYKTHLTEESVIWYYRKPLCRQVPLYFEKKLQEGQFNAYKYVLRENVYDRYENLDDDCFKGFKHILPDGLSDISKCFFDMPFAASNPHFYGRYPNELTKKIDGMKPDKEKHQSYTIVEPIMGVPINQSARSQNNVIIPELYGYSEEIQRFSNMALPTFWVEFHQNRLTPSIENLMYFTLNVLPIAQYVFTAFLLIAGISCLIIGVLRCMSATTDEYSSTKLNSDTSKFNENCKLHETDIPWNLK